MMILPSIQYKFPQYSSGIMCLVSVTVGMAAPVCGSRGRMVDMEA